MLNARPDSVQREAAIIAQAGLPRRSPYGYPALTISTSMAGRGTDIRLGGDPQGLMRLGLRTLLLPCMIKGASFPVAQSDALGSARESCPVGQVKASSTPTAHSNLAGALLLCVRTQSIAQNSKAAAEGIA